MSPRRTGSIVARGEGKTLPGIVFKVAAARRPGCSRCRGPRGFETFFGELGELLAAQAPHAPPL